MTAAELFNSGIIDKKTLGRATQGSRGDPGPLLPAARKVSLGGSGCIAGLTTPSTREVLSFYEASKKGLIPWDLQPSCWRESSGGHRVPARPPQPPEALCG